MKTLKSWFYKTAVLWMTLFLICAIGILRAEAATSIFDTTDGDTFVEVEATTDEDIIHFDTAGSERMTITDTGNVGIGTTDPQYLLDVAGTIRATAIEGTSGNPVTFADGITAGTNSIDIGKQSNTITFDSADGTIQTESTNDLLLNPNNAGFVGIGTSTPSEKLDVTGNAHVSGTLDVDGAATIGAYTLPSTDGANGQVLTADGAGGVAWESSVAGDITDVFDCNAGDCNAITVSDGDLLDFSSVNASGGTEGIILPQNTSCEGATTEGQLCWDSDNDMLSIGDGSAANDISEYYVGTFTHDTTSSADQTITGVGFEPRLVNFILQQDTTGKASWGWDDGSGSGKKVVVMRGTPKVYEWRTGDSIASTLDGSVYAVGAIKNFTNNGFVLRWTKLGSPTGTVGIIFTAFK